eukprot:2075269-Alexandrium_andersonii.AAC.1
MLGKHAASSNCCPRSRTRAKARRVPRQHVGAKAYATFATVSEARAAKYREVTRKHAGGKAIATFEL